MKRHVVGVASSSVVFFLFACGSSAGGGMATTGGTGGGGGSGYICEFTPAIGALCTGCSGVEECDAFAGSALTGETLTLVESTCTLETSYSNPSACPTASRIGCCEYPYISSAIAVTENSCFYGTASSETAKLPTQCGNIIGGIWTPN